MAEYNGTIKSKENFDSRWSAERFMKALRGYGSDERALVQLLISHDWQQRQDMERKYKALYGTDLIDDLRIEFGGNFEETAEALMTPPDEYLTYALHEALTADEVDEKTVIEILCNKTPKEIYNIDLIYSRKFESDLDDAIHLNLSGDFLHLMASIVSQGREDRQRIDSIMARKDAQDLYDAGIGDNVDTSQSEFIRIMNTRSYPQLQETFKEYERISLEPIEKSICNEFKDDLRRGLLAIVQRVKDPLGFFAERLNESMRGAATDDKTLIRTIVTRAEIDLEDIKRRYKEMYGSTLISDVRADTSGDYGKLLIAIIGT